MGYVYKICNKEFHWMVNVRWLPPWKQCGCARKGLTYFNRLHFFLSAIHYYMLNVRIFRLFFAVYLYHLLLCFWLACPIVRPSVRGLLTPFVIVDCIMFLTGPSDCQSVRPSVRPMFTYAICNCGLYYDIDWPVRVSVRPYVRGLLTPFVILDCIMFSTDLSECQSVRRFTYAICNCGLYYVFD